MCCAFCQAFQVQQVKKVAKFSCTLCGSKQSVLRVYAISGSAKDVRGVVQRLNMARGSQAEQPVQQPVQQEPEEEEEGAGEATCPAGATAPRAPPCWSDYQEPEPAGTSASAHDDDWGEPGYLTILPDHPGSKRQRGGKARTLGHASASSGGDEDGGGQGSKRSRPLGSKHMQQNQPFVRQAAPSAGVANCNAPAGSSKLPTRGSMLPPPGRQGCLGQQNMAPPAGGQWQGGFEGCPGQQPIGQRPVGQQARPAQPSKLPPRGLLPAAPAHCPAHSPWGGEGGGGGRPGSGLGQLLG